MLFVIAAVMAGLDGTPAPGLDALTPRLVDRHELPAASALNSFRGNIGMIAGPAVAGIAIAAGGLDWSRTQSTSDTFVFTRDA